MAARVLSLALSAGLVALTRAASAHPLALQTDLAPAPAPEPPPSAAAQLPAQLLGPAAAPPFVPPAGAARERTIACLTAAIYYEAGSQPREGQEAVAQVVLNRVRHPGFPKSICGVVYEGAGRSTGCQFSFTCDGSTRRRPSPARWRAAEAVAVAALDGHVAAEVGASTHYHALSVRPAWRTTLVETARIGAHVFYRLPGAPGSPDALVGGYRGYEPPAPIGAFAAASSPAAAPPAPGSTLFSVWGLPVANVSVRHRAIVVGPPRPP